MPQKHFRSLIVKVLFHNSTAINVFLRLANHDTKRIHALTDTSVELTLLKRERLEREGFECLDRYAQEWN